MDTIDKERYIDEANAMYTEFGYSPKVLRANKGKQDLRFNILTSMMKLENEEKCILDLGCGFGDLKTYLDQKKYRVKYIGVDIVETFINKAKELHPDGLFICEDFLEMDMIKNVDYVIACGPFNYKFLGKISNYEFIEKCMNKAMLIAKEGIAFDFLSNKVDYQYDHTFHSSPEKILEMAYKLSRNVSLRNDYMPFEFSLFINKDDSFDKADTIFRKYKEETGYIWKPIE